MKNHNNWLLKNLENAIEPNLPICDPHHHLWDFRKDYIDKKYLIEEFLKDSQSGHNIVSTVFIECGAMYNKASSIEENVINETEFANGIAAMSASGLYGKTKIAAGIVGCAPLLIGKKVVNILDRHISINPSRFKGVRTQAAMHPDGTIPSFRARPIEGVYMHEKFREGFKELAARKLSFEAWCYHPQLPELIDLAKSFPDTIIILNHFGGPLGVGSFKNREKEVYDAWKKNIVSLAKCDNVFAKLGGIAMEINGHDWHKKSLPPSSDELINKTLHYYETTIESFGVERCMFESNFPVDKISCSYLNLWNSFKKMTAHYSKRERSYLFHDTASNVYKLN